MKSISADFLPSSLRGAALPVLVAVCLSIAGATVAQEKNSAPAAPAPAAKPVAPQPTPPPASDLSNVALPSSVDVYVNEIDTRKKDIFEKLGKANKRVEEKNFEQAIALFKEVEADIAKMHPGKVREGIFNDLRKRRDDTCSIWAEQLLQDALGTYISMLKEKDLTRASEQAEEIKKNILTAKFVYYTGNPRGDKDVLPPLIRANPEFSNRADAIVADCDRVQGLFDFMQETSLEAVEPGYADRQKQIAKFYVEGEKLYRLRRFEDARDKMEQIILLDPYNEKAVMLLSRIYRKLYSIADIRQYNELLADQANNEWHWMDNLPREKRLDPEKTAREYTESNSPLFEKLKAIRIPSISFSETDISGAVKQIQRLSVEHDEQDRVGININLKLKSNKDSSDSVSSLSQQTVTFELKNVPLLEVIRYLTLNTGLKYRVDEKHKTVVIGLPHIIMDGENMDRIFIPIRHATILRMLGEDTVKKEEKGSKDFSVDGAMDGMDLETTFSEGIASSSTKRASRPAYSGALRKYFETLGFAFGEGTFIAYDSRKNRLMVRNTPDILRKLELLIRSIDIDTPLVLIEAKMLEIGLSDLEELGFDWTLTHDSDNPRWSFAIASPLRSSPNSNNILINNMNILPNFGPDNSWNLFLTVNAIDRTDRSEILSTPKIIAKNGMSGRIRMVRQMYFPESWSEPEISTSCGSSISLEPSYPEFGDATDVGIIFEATPTVNPNNYTINLTLNPSVVDLVGWSDYSYDMLFGYFGTRSSNNSGNSSTEMQSSRITLKMPELSVRQVETQVKVYDGQTIVIGGMLTDRQTGRDDRWPILGEIPLVGRLFSQRYKDVEKQNLMISVTSRLISGDGIPLRSFPNGLPDFHR